MKLKLETPVATTRKVVLCLCVGVFAAGFGIGLIAVHKPASPSPATGSECPADLKFVRPENDCAQFANAVATMNTLQNDMSKQVSTYLGTGRAKRISIFVRDLDSQRIASINETEKFVMASLVKLPLAIAYFRLAEVTPDLLSQKILYDGSEDQYPLQDIQPPKKLSPGREYSVRDLIHRMLAYSDNTAAELLSRNFVSYDYLQKIIAVLGLLPKPQSDPEYMATARMYAGVMRTLYNSSLLTREFSNEILSDLSEGAFTDGATAKLPSSVAVAHKFGERDLTTGTSASDSKPVLQLHDCGIVFATTGLGPYSYCIMTEGSSFADLESVIQNVSLTIYTDISS